MFNRLIKLCTVGCQSHQWHALADVWNHPTVMDVQDVWIWSGSVLQSKGCVWESVCTRKLVCIGLPYICKWLHQILYRTALYAFVYLRFLYLCMHCMT